MTLVDVNPTTLEDCKTFMHVDHGEEIMVVEIFMLLIYLSTC